MKGEITLRIVSEPNKETKVIIEKTNVDMNYEEVNAMCNITSYIQSTINKLNDYSK